MGKRDVAVVGIGNVLLGDDGVGVHLIDELRKRYSFSAAVELIDGGTMGLDLLPFMEGKSKVIFIDALNLDAEPGTIGELKNDEIPAFLSTRLSVHQIALPDMLAAGALIGTLPSEMYLIGIKPYNIETGYGLTPVIDKKVDELVTRVISKLEEWGAGVTLKIDH